MANCVCCNREMPADSIWNELCPACVQAMDTGVDPAPLEAAQSLPGREEPVFTEDSSPIEPEPARVRFPVTRTLVLINIVVFVLGFSVEVSTRQKLAEWGPATLGGEWWRMFTSMFLHDGWENFLGNMGTLWIVGKMIEQMFSKWTFLYLYFLTGLGAKILSLSVHPEIFSCGASGAIFGITGVAFAALILGRLPPGTLRPDWRIRVLLFFIWLSLSGGDTDPRVNYLAHLGGFMSGLVLGALLCTRLDQSATERMNRFEQRVFSGMGVFLLLGAISLRLYYKDIIPLSAAQQALEAGKPEEAARIARAVIEKRPDDVEAHLFLARAYIRERDYKRAKTAVDRSLELDPDNRDAARLQRDTAWLRR